MTDIAPAHLYQAELLQEDNLTEYDDDADLTEALARLQKITTNLIRNAEVAKLKAKALSLGGMLCQAFKIIPGSYVWVETEIKPGVWDGEYIYVSEIKDDRPDCPNIRLIYEEGEDLVRRTAYFIVWVEGMDTPLNELVAAWGHYAENAPD